MTVQLSNLRVALTMDGSNYVHGAAAIAEANKRMAESGTLAGAQLAQQDIAAGRAGGTLAALSKKNIDGYASASQFARGVSQLQTQMDLGNVSSARAATIYTGLVNRFGMVADASVIAGKGGKDFAAVVDGVNQKVSLQPAVFDKSKSSISATTVAVNQLQMQMVAMAAGAGPVGVFLAALGPWGLAAAVGVGLVAAAFREAKRTADLLAREADALQNQAEVTGLSTASLQALTMAAARHGVSAEQATQSIIKFTTAWSEARVGTGAMIVELRKIDPALAAQIQRTKDGATAFEILTRAINRADAAGDIAQRNMLARAAGGRGGVIGLTGISAAVGEAGGLANLTRNAADAGKVIGDNLLSEIDNLKDELDEAKKRADLLFGTIGAKPILETELAWQKMRQQMAGVLSDIANGSSQLSPWMQFLTKLSSFALGPVTTGKLFGVPRGGAGDQPALNQMPDYPPQLNMAGVDVPAAPKDIKAQLADLREQISLLGSAATENDKLRLRLLELRSAIDGNKTAENELAAARGMSAAQLDAYISTLNLHNAAMGAAASTADVVAAKMAALQKQQMLGAGLAEAEIDNQRRVATENANGTAGILTQTESLKIQAATIGLSAGAAAALSAKLQLLAQDARTGKVATDEDTAARERAARALGAHAQELERLRIAADIRRDRQTTFLTQEDVQIAEKLKNIYPDVADALNSVEAAQIRANNAVRGLSQELSGGLSTALLDISMGTKQTGEAFRSFGLIAVQALQKMIIQLMIIGPLMQSLQSSFGGGGFNIFSLFGLGGGGFSGIGLGDPLAGIGHSGAVIGVTGERRYIHPAYFDDAPRMHGGGRIDWAAGERPFVGKVGEEIGWPSQLAAKYGSGGGTVINVSQVNNITGSPDMSKDEFMAILAKNNKQLAKDIDRSLPDRVAAINRDPRKR